MLFIRKANMIDIEKEWQFIRNMPEEENGITNSWHGISKEDFEKIALLEMIDFSEGKNLPEGFVPETFLFLWNEDTIVG